MPLFTLREVPTKLHKRWKLMSSIHQVSMRDIAIKALEGYITKLEQSINIDMGKINEARESITGKKSD